MYRLLVIIALLVLFISPSIKQEITNGNIAATLNAVHVQIKKIEDSPKIKSAIDSFFIKVQKLVDQFNEGN